MTSKVKSSSSGTTARIQATGASHPGTYTFPDGGTLVVTEKGISTYTGPAAQKVELKAKYLAWADDHDASGKIKVRIK